MSEKVEIGIGHVVRALSQSFEATEVEALREAMLFGSMDSIEFVDDEYSLVWNDSKVNRKAAEVPEYIGQGANAQGDFVGGYEVVSRNYIAKDIYSPDIIVKIGHNPEAVQPWGTWLALAEDPKDNFSGHYWFDEDVAREDFERRVSAERYDVEYDYTTLVANMKGYETNEAWEASEEYASLPDCFGPEKAEPHFSAINVAAKLAVEGIGIAQIQDELWNRENNNTYSVEKDERIGFDKHMRRYNAVELCEVIGVSGESTEFVASHYARDSLPSLTDTLSANKAKADALNATQLQRKAEHISDRGLAI